MSDPMLRLVSDVAELEACWEEHPLVSRCLADFSDVFSLAGLESLLATAPISTSFVRLMHDGAELKSETLARPRERSGPGAEPLVDGGKIVDEVRRGTTLVLEEVQSWIPEVAAFARGVESATGYGTYCAAFLTPADACGVRAHYDLASVFIRQVYGSKRWQIGSPVEFRPKEAWAGRKVPLRDRQEVLLREGDCLYLPRGYIHVGDTTGEASLHLSIAVKPVTWESVLVQEIRSLADHDHRLREALPFGFHRAAGSAMAERMAAVTSVVGDHVTRLPTEDAWKGIRARYAPSDVPAADGLSDALGAKGQAELHAGDPDEQ
ncbi:Cupin superfamily protein [Murinocardiopsis flavida]|uniref:Cupin superfamily protein n=1 Tax=Murinocardiopsis flavida TaxID=645275 RepID=A0A2P8D562_9ACTN|nr:cupin domain-containing protein [Murinocardiopsis flavida]PSK92357.1 Cupin superfamily protein [Murinocardiopsis flavida]